MGKQVVLLSVETPLYHYLTESLLAGVMGKTILETNLFEKQLYKPITSTP